LSWFRALISIALPSLACASVVGRAVRVGGTGGWRPASGDRQRVPRDLEGGSSSWWPTTSGKCCRSACCPDRRAAVRGLHGGAGRGEPPVPICGGCSLARTQSSTGPVAGRARSSGNVQKRGRPFVVSGVDRQPDGESESFVRGRRGWSAPPSMASPDVVQSAPSAVTFRDESSCCTVKHAESSLPKRPHAAQCRATLHFVVRRRPLRSRRSQVRILRG
jgi:hypothetical protein